MTPRSPPDGRRRDRPAPDPGRGVSDLVGFVLVFSLVVSVVAVVSVAGFSSLESARDAERTNNAERAMEVLRDNMADVTDRGAPSRATEVSLDEASLRLGDRIQIEVTDPNNDTKFLTTTTFGVRPIIYDDGDTELVYAMGAVFRDGPRGGTVVEPWRPVLDEERTVIPLVETTSASGDVQSLQSDTVLVRSSLNRRITHVAKDDYSEADVWINVTSPRTELWERMLSDDPKISCPSPAAGANEVQCHLDYDPDEVYVVGTRIAVDLKR